VNHLKQETQKLNKLREGIQRKLRDVENHKVEVEQQRETLRSQVMAIERGRYDNYTSPLSSCCSDGQITNRIAFPNHKSFDKMI